MPTLLSIGHGYCAQALAAQLLPEGWQVLATTRNPAKRESLAATGAEPVLWPQEGMEAIGRASHLLSSVPPDAGGDPVLRDHGAALAARTWDWAGYLSTTAVYGNHDGGWVDETTPLTPASERGRWRVAAEAAWAAVLPVHIFRLAGIYGPGRGPFEKVRDGTARCIVKPGQVFGRIHVEDIARVLAASIAAPAPGTAYNLCDDDPAPPQDVLAHAAALLGLPPPPEVAYADADLSPMARSFYGENKRVRNDRIKALSGPLRFPTYREGLAALLAG